MPSLFFVNNTCAPQGNMLGLIYPFSNISFNYSFNYTNSGVLIQYGALDTMPNIIINPIENFISLLSESLGIYSRNVSQHFFII